MDVEWQYSICNDRQPHLSHQTSRTALLRNTSISGENSDDQVFRDEPSNPSMSLRSGSDQCDPTGTVIFTNRPLIGTSNVSFRRDSIPETEQPKKAGIRRLSFQDRPLPSPPTPYDNVDHQGNVQSKTTRLRSTSNTSSSSSGGSFFLSKRSKFEKQLTRCRICFAMVVFALSFIASFFSVYTYFVMTFDRPDQVYCVPCSKLTQIPDREGIMGYHLTTKIVGDQELCCVDSSYDLETLLGQIQYYEKVNCAVSQNMTSAHVGLYANTEGRNVRSINSMTFYRLSISREPSLLHHDNVLVGSTSLGIITTGRYFVYTSLHFNLSVYGGSCNNLVHKTWLYHVYRGWGPDTKIKTALLRSEHTCCENCADDNASGFTGGVFKLHAGNQIYVEVSAPPLVVDRKESSYMGLFLVRKD